MPSSTDRYPSVDDATWVAIAASVWFLAALVVGAAGVLLLLPPPFPQVVILALVVALGVALWISGGFRRWAMSVDVRILVLLHVSRLFAGLYFLFLAGRGTLPPEFAVTAGWGDIAVAVLALLLVLFVPLETRGGRVALLVWNVLGFLDILFVVATAARIGMQDPYAIRPFLWLPLSLLPTFLVPVIVFTHLLIFARGRLERP